MEDWLLVYIRTYTYIQQNEKVELRLQLSLCIFMFQLFFKQAAHAPAELVGREYYLATIGLGRSRPVYYKD